MWSSVIDVGHSQIWRSASLPLKLHMLFGCCLPRLCLSLLLRLSLQVHLYGTSLGGFLCQLYAAYRPRRVRSLVLSNTFLDTKNYHEELSWSSL